MMRELHTVVLTRDLRDHGLIEGDVGTVVHAYEGADQYEVEFVSGAGETVAVLTLEATHIRAIGAAEILHARDRSSV